MIGITVIQEEVLNLKKLANNTAIVSQPKSYFASTNYYAALADTTATHHYLDEKVKPYCTEQHPANGTNFQVSNGKIINQISQLIVEISNKLSSTAQLDV